MLAQLNPSSLFVHAAYMLVCVSEVNELAGCVKGLGQVQVPLYKQCQCLSGATWRDKFNPLFPIVRKHLSIKDGT